MKKIKYLYFLISIIFIGCGGSSSSSGQKIQEQNTTVIQQTTEKITTETNSTLIEQNQSLNVIVKNMQNKPTLEPDYKYQWYIEFNKTVYSNTIISENANISALDSLDKYNGKGVKIAIIDDGLDIYHEEIAGSITKTYDLTTKSSNVAHNNSSDFHGTAVTGIIAAKQNEKGIYGIANGAEILFLKFKHTMSDSETIELFEKAKEFGADIINCSWGTGSVSYSVKNEIINLATNGRNGKGIIIVFASGNSNIDIVNDESGIDEVISVGASDVANLRAAYSNYGANLDILAPGGSDGIGIATIKPYNKYIMPNDENAFIGTSAAAPIVTSAVALILEKNPNLTRIEVENILKSSADKIGNIRYINGKNQFYGYGKINLYKSLGSF